MKFTFGGEELTFQDPSQYPMTEPMEKVQAVDRAADGTLKVEALGVNIKTRTLHFENMSKQDHDGLKDWFDRVANGAANVFDFEDEFGVSYRCRITSPTFEFQLTFFELYAGDMTLEYV